ncbi:hypothetical protein SAMN05216321_101102 [Cupriavidus sp. OV038]|uniref:hypothetical protein n=1 Tax=unclassified Cupriavidus TaxID=2640874 RepID=UPI0008E35FC7|nr:MULTISPECIES: hypothetical protein [unclassified Cupriavidus]SFB68411.1 hypothetical protein SAMN05216321_101102 [Cupriavidus sp. OV038]SFO57648.1 hypothetical protein SAMN05216322_101102 [Cupriavidus sp. OV096]
MDYGVTKDGFVRKRLPEIRREIVAGWEGGLRAKGYTGVIETRPDSVTGLLIDTFAEREAALWELAEGVYYAMYPTSASGVPLDNAVAFTGAKRKAAEPSRCYVVAYGVEGTAIEAGAQIRHRTTQNLWGVVDGATITVGAAADVLVAVAAVTANADYTVFLNAVPYTYRTGTAPTAVSIVYGLANALLTSGQSIESTATGVRIFTDGRASFSALLSTNLRFASVGSPALAQTLDKIAEVALPGDLSQIVTQTDGWASVSNLQPGSAGRTAENDAALRLSYGRGIYRLGAGTLPSIAANIDDLVPGVVAVRDFENDSDFPDEYGRPPHSIHVVVDGGLDQDIGDAIFRVKGGGIDTYGAVEVTVTDKYGNKRLMQFDRPGKVYVWAKARVQLLPAAEQEFPTDGYERIQKGIVAVGKTLEIGEDIVVQKLYRGVYVTPGVAYVDLRLICSTDPNFVPIDQDFSAGNWPVKPFERADFDLSRVEVLPWI